MTEVKIRAFEMTDWEDVAELFLAPSCWWETLQMPYQSRAQIKHNLENASPEMHRLVAVVNDEQKQKVVGTISLLTFSGRRTHVGQLSVFVHDDYQNQGIGSKLMEAVIDLAENWLNLKRLELTVNTDKQERYPSLQEIWFRHRGYFAQECFSRWYLHRWICNGKSQIDK